MDEAVVRWLMQPEALHLEPPPLEELLRRPAWHAQAACRGNGTAAFFPARGEPSSAGKALCAVCPVRPQCLDTAMADPAVLGVWGGTSERERAQLRRRAG